jgi:ABC-2 type transport system permease protein
MKLAASVIKSFKENVRDWKVLTLVLLFSPFFLVLIYLFYGQSPATYKIGIINLDKREASADLTESIKSSKGPDDKGLFQIKFIEDIDKLKVRVIDKTIDIGIVIPKDYSDDRTDSGVIKNGKSAMVNFYGSMSNARYTIAAVLVADIINKQGVAAADITLPYSISEVFVEKNLPLNEFDSYVPGLLSLAVLMILFTATASIVKENDKKTLIRLKLSRLGAFDFLMGVCIVQTVIALAALALSYLTALLLGYRPEGSLGSILILGVISSFSMVSISLIVASFLNTVYDVLTIGCFPFFILMFFSGSMLPLPKLTVLTLRGHSLGITDVLPLTHTVNGLNRILNYGAGLKEILFDLIMLVILTFLYFLAGLLLYHKRKLSKA